MQNYTKKQLEEKKKAIETEKKRVSTPQKYPSPFKKKDSPAKTTRALNTESSANLNFNEMIDLKIEQKLKNSEKSPPKSLLENCEFCGKSFPESIKLQIL